MLNVSPKVRKMLGGLPKLEAVEGSYLVIDSGSLSFDVKNGEGCTGDEGDVNQISVEIQHLLSPTVVSQNDVSIKSVYATHVYICQSSLRKITFIHRGRMLLRLYMQHCGRGYQNCQRHSVLIALM